MGCILNRIEHFQEGSQVNKFEHGTAGTSTCDGGVVEEPGPGYHETYYMGTPRCEQTDQQTDCQTDTRENINFPQTTHAGSKKSLI